MDQPMTAINLAPDNADCRPPARSAPVDGLRDDGTEQARRLLLRNRMADIVSGGRVSRAEEERPV